MAADVFTPEQQARMLQLFREWHLTEHGMRRPADANAAETAPADKGAGKGARRESRSHHYAGPDREIPAFCDDREAVDRAARLLQSLAARFKHGIKVDRNDLTPRGNHVNTVVVQAVEQWPHYKAMRDLDFDGRFADIHPQALAVAMAEDRPHQRGEWKDHRRWSIWNLQGEVIIRYFC